MKLLTKDTFKNEIANGVVLVDMYADWCGPCRALTPMLEEMDGKIEGVTFTKLDVDEADEIAQSYGVMSIPCVVIFKNGQEAGRIVGLRMKEDYENELKRILAIA
jgi:thioredoxin 1